MRYLIAMFLLSGCCAAEADEPKPAAPKETYTAAVQRFEASVKGLSETVGNVTSELEGVKEELKAVRSDLTEIKSLLSVPNEIAVPVPPVEPPPVKVDAPPVDDTRNASDPSPTLLLFTSKTCPPCRTEEARVASLEAAGEVVRICKSGEDQVEFDAYNVDCTPTWIRLDANGNEVGRVPKSSQHSYLNSDRDKLLGIGPLAKAVANSAGKPKLKPGFVVAEAIPRGGVRFVPAGRHSKESHRRD